MLPIVLAPLLKNGLNLLASVAMDKGTQWLKQETGIDLEKKVPTEAELKVLQDYQFKNEELLLNFKLQNRKLDNDETAMIMANVQSARDMQIAAIQQGDLFTKKFTYIFAAILSALIFGYAFAITFFAIPEQNIRFADSIMGMLLGGAFMAIINFLYGSTVSSRRKDEVNVLKELPNEPR